MKMRLKNEKELNEEGEIIEGKNLLEIALEALERIGYGLYEVD
jgi:hypothetical protein